MGVIVKVFDQETLVLSTELEKSLEIGRQQQDEPPPFTQVDTSSGPRLIVEKLSQTTISRKHVLLELLSQDRVRVVNQSSQLPVMIHARHASEPGVKLNHAPDTEALLNPGQRTDTALPLLMTIGSKTIRVEQVLAENFLLEGLETMTLAPGRASAPATLFVELLEVENRSAVGESVLDWLQKTMDVFQRSAGSSDFLPHAAQAVLDTVGLDVAAILIWENGDWKNQAVAKRQNLSEIPWKPSTTILNRVREEKRTFRQHPNYLTETPVSLFEVHELVAAPILNSRGDVIGAIYGDRRKNSWSQQIEISPLEAKLVELLACGVAAGLARLEHEKVAIAARVQFEQFFTPELARELEQDADLLVGRDSEVTLLIGDISGFSRISERLGPKGTVAWINDALDTFSECVFQERGVLVDYVGDELFAMWGAPAPSEDQAQRCCRAGLAMQSHLPRLNARWQAELGETFGFGIGINTGLARVGNVGSKRKFKYGPLGNAVNLTSRVQGATKFLQTRLLITGTTAARLDQQFAKRRLCTVRVVGIQEPVELFELVYDAQPEWFDMRDRYESALAAFEKGDLYQTAMILGSLLSTHPKDGPAVLLLSRAANLLQNNQQADFNPIWDLPGK